MTEAYEPHEGDEVEVTVRGTMVRDEGGQWGMRYADVDTYGRMRSFVFRSALDGGRVTLVRRALLDEPPNRAVCRGKVSYGSDPDLWYRRDVPEDGTGASTWWLDGDAFTYERALAAGMDPSRRLMELPDPDDLAAMNRLAARARWHARTTADAKCVEDEAWVVRALAEQGEWP